MKLSTQILLAFVIVIILSVADTYTNYRLSFKVEKNIEFLARSESVIRNSNKIHKAIIQMQSACRGYLLTNDTTFLDLYFEGIKSVPGYFEEQIALITENRDQVRLLKSIHALHRQWIEYANPLIESRKKISASEPGSDYAYLFENSLRKLVGKKLNDAITVRFGDFDKSEYKSRDIHSAALLSSIKQTHTFSFLFITLTVVAGICSAVYIVVLISKRISSMVKLAENITRGDFTIVHDTRNDELTGLSRSLNIMSGRLDKTILDLKKRNEELNKFAYVVSHDLKTPLRGIHNVIKWIEEDLGGELSPEMKKYLVIIPQRTERMENLINGLLDYARISEPSHPEEINLNILVADICNEIVPREFKVEINDLPILYSERLKLEQVFTNLISNSVRYTDHLNGQIVISCKDFRGYYQFSIKDNGIGIDSSYHEKIFEIFQTLREKNEKESTGVGLAIVKKIIDDKHGSIKVNSMLGKGAEFIFTWPKNEIS